jgi:phosphatidate phosphatase LPIN
MWEWGAFPQRSPLIDRFPRGSIKRGLRAEEAPTLGSLPTAQNQRGDLGRSKSEPAQSDPESGVGVEKDQVLENSGLAASARLIRDNGDPMRIGAYTTGHTLWFELSVVDLDSIGHAKGKKGVLFGMEAVEAGNVFEQGAVSYEQFLQDESVLREEGLVIRLADDR